MKEATWITGGAHSDSGTVEATPQQESGHPDQVWRAVLDYLRLQLPTEAYETWFSPTRALGLDSGHLTVAVPNAFFPDWLTQHYSAVIRSALATVGGANLRVSFVVNRPTSRQGTLLPAHTAEERLGPAAGASRLQARYTFDSFVVGESNRMAWSAARSVATNPASSYNPLFIYGGVGLGKTHLLQAIGNHRLQIQGRTRICYAAAETVFIELIQAIERNTRLEFKNRYRGLDVLLLDDIHYLVGKERLQEEIFHIFNHLHDSGSQIVFTSDRPPKDIPTLEERLVSRLGSGLVVDIQAPDIETRLAILKRRAALEQVALPEEVCYHLASRVKTNVRLLEGSLTRLLAIMSLEGRPPTVELAEAVLRDLLPPETVVDSNRIIQGVAEHFHIIPSNQLRGTSRTKRLVLARQTAMYLMRTILNASLNEIGQQFGGRDHTTVMHALQKITQLRRENPGFAADVAALQRRLTGEQNR